MTDPMDNQSSYRPRRRNVFLGVSVMLFGLLIITGVMLMTVYSPSTASAWGSVWYMQTQVPYGWLIRGLHHFASDALLIVVALHVVQMIASRLYRTPRKIIWWTTLGLLGITLALSLTGHLLPWDQEAYWGTTVRVNILARTPVIGAALRSLVVGGSQLGQLTITRFYTLHVVVLSGLAVVFLDWRSRANRRVSAQSGTDAANPTAESYAPGQLFRDTIVFALVISCVVGVLAYARFGLHTELLGAPADATTTDYPARPEWHTLFLYQWLKLFEGPWAEMVGAILIPGLVGLVFVMFPWLDRGGRRSAGRIVVLIMTSVLLIGVGSLSYLAVQADRRPNELTLLRAVEKQTTGEALSTEESHALARLKFRRQRDHERYLAKRSLELASAHGIPPSGPLELMRNDPRTRGPILFAAHCASCHRYDGHDGLGNTPAEPPTSSDLVAYASRGWIRGLLNDPMADRYFGLMKTPDGKPAHTRMRKFMNELRNENSSDEAKRKLRDDLNAASNYLEDEGKRPGRLKNLGSTDKAPEDSMEETLYRGRRYFMRVCNECHSYDGEREGTFKAPEMLGYGSVEWIELMIADPAHETRYRSKGKQPARMPSFADRIAPADRRLIAQWLHESVTAPALYPSQ